MADHKTAIISLSQDGILTWSQPTNHRAYFIETTTLLNSTTEWKPWIRGWASNEIVHLKVEDFDEPRMMTFVPGGFFTMGHDDIRTLGNIEHEVFVSPFYIGKYETTVEQVVNVYQWALDHERIASEDSYFVNLDGDSRPLLKFNHVESLVEFDGSLIRAIEGRENHPCPAITWYGAVAYCNFLSEMEGRELCYDFGDWSCDFSKTGFRLPTESEWEKAARGGFEGRLFPWGDTITHSEANYRSTEENSYDISPTRDFHPIYDENRPVRTAPVGSFGPNNYGLYDVIGNVAEWCWDVSGRYTGNTLYDPRGPEDPLLSMNPLFKGGNWFTTSERVLLPYRYTAAPRDYTTPDVGFRIVTITGKE